MQLWSVHKRIRPRTHLYDLARGRIAQPVQALGGATCAIAPGEFVAVRGANGSGKTTLLSLLAGVSRPDTGEVVAASPPAALLSSRLGLIAHRTVLAHLELHTAPAEAALVPQVIDRLGLEALLQRRADELSAGQRVRLAIGCALLAGCHTWLLDEVTSALDDEALGTLSDWLRERGDTVIVVAHDDRCRVDRVIQLRAGRIAAESETPPGHAPQRPSRAQALGGLGTALRFLSATERRPGPWIRRIIMTLAGLLLPWQLSRGAVHPRAMVVAMWCGLAALGLQVSASEDGLRRLNAVVLTGLDDVLRARGVTPRALVLACLAPPLLFGALWALAVPLLVVALADARWTPSVASLDLAAAALVGIGGVALSTFALAILLRNSSPLPWLLHVATLALGPVTVARSALPDLLRTVGEHLPAAMLAPALRQMADLPSPPPALPWIGALVWLGAGVLTLEVALRQFECQGSLGLRSL